MGTGIIHGNGSGEHTVFGKCLHEQVIVYPLVRKNFIWIIGPHARMQFSWFNF
jgi:hypothetical protein